MNHGTVPNQMVPSPALAKDPAPEAENQRHDFVALDKSVQPAFNHALRLSDAVGYKLSVFKNIFIPAGDNTVFVSKGEIYGASIPKSVLDFIKIKLVQPAGSKGQTISTDTVWTIERVNQNLFTVNDPSIEYIELKGPGDRYLIDLFNVLGNAIQMRSPTGAVITYKALLPAKSSAGASVLAPRCEVSQGEVYLNNFPTEFAEEFQRELSLLPKIHAGISNQYAMKKYPYANWYYWVSGVLEALCDIWQVQRSSPVPGKAVILGTNYIYVPGPINEIPWKKNDTVNDALAKPPWPKGKIELKITITDAGKVSANLIDSQFSKGVSSALVSSVNKLSKHPSIIFPNVFPEKLFADERNLALNQQKLYMGVSKLPEFKSITFNCTFRNSEIRK
jgi:hypothetical protein